MIKPTDRHTNRIFRPPLPAISLFAHKASRLRRLSQIILTATLAVGMFACGEDALEERYAEAMDEAFAALDTLTDAYQEFIYAGKALESAFLTHPINKSGINMSLSDFTSAISRLEITYQEYMAAYAIVLRIGSTSMQSQWLSGSTERHLRDRHREIQKRDIPLAIVEANITVRQLNDLGYG